MCAELLWDISVFISQIKYNTVTHCFVILIGMNISAEHLYTCLLILFQERCSCKTDEYRIRHDCLHCSMKLARLRSVTLINKDKDFSFRLKVSRERLLQLINILVIIGFSSFSATATKFMHQ